MLDVIAFGVCLIIAALIVWIACGKKPEPRVRPERSEEFDLASGKHLHPRASEAVVPQAGRRR